MHKRGKRNALPSFFCPANLQSKEQAAQSSLLTKIVVQSNSTRDAHFWHRSLGAQVLVQRAMNAPLGPGTAHCLLAHAATISMNVDFKPPRTAR